MGGLRSSAAALPGPTPTVAESTNRTRRYRVRPAAVAHSPRRHPMERAPMVGGVSPRGEPPWGTIGARERGGSGLGFGPGNPGPHLRLKQRHTARVQRPSGQNPRTKGAHTHTQTWHLDPGVSHTPAAAGQQQQQARREEPWCTPARHISQRADWQYAGWPSSLPGSPSAPGRTEEERAEREDKNIEHTECSIEISL